MKRKIVGIVVAVCILASAAVMSGCDLLEGLLGGAISPPPAKDYNADITVVAPEDVTTEHFTPQEGTTYYTSPGLLLCVEVNGAFVIIEHFSLDGNKRVYDDLYFYKEDYFYIVTDDYKDLYAALGDPADTQYAEEERQQGEEVQINIKKEGIYKLIFDVDTLKFDLEYKSEITTPRYYTIKDCCIYTVLTSWIDMSVNPANPDEFMLQNVALGEKEVFFYGKLHVSNYKITLDASCNNTLASARKNTLTVNVVGNYNVYINAKTYVVRLELLNPDTATYSCIYYDGSEYITLTPYEEDVPHVFRQRVVATTKYTTSVPKFHSAKYQTYKLIAEESDLIMGSDGDYTFKQPGEYEIIINLRTFTFEVVLLPQ